MNILLGVLSLWGCEEKKQEPPDITITTTAGNRITVNDVNFLDVMLAAESLFVQPIL